MKKIAVLLAVVFCASTLAFAVVNPVAPTMNSPKPKVMKVMKVKKVKKVVKMNKTTNTVVPVKK